MSDDYWDKLEKARAARERSPRRFPMPQGGNRGKAGWCQWCGGEIVHGKRPKARGWHDGREDEPNCIYEYRLHTRIEDQFPFLVARDGEKCWDCGEVPTKVVRGYVLNQYARETEFRPFWGYDQEGKWAPVGEVLGAYQEVRFAPALDVDHEIPLWMVAHKPPDERRRFFGPENLHLRCSRGQCCHQRKTAAEATLRGKNNRMRDGPKPAKRKIQSRGFDKTKTRGFDDRVKPRSK